MDTSAEAPPSFAASLDSSLPPRYQERRAPVLSAASGTPNSRECVYTLDNGGKPWAFLKVKCRPGPSTSVPSFIQGEPIAGTVELHLAKKDHIQAVTIEARGESLCMGKEPTRFLSQKTTLWSVSMGNPGSEDSSPGSAKLMGDYIWPFYITLPAKVLASPVAKGQESEYPLPPSLSERTSPASLQYKLIVTLCRGKLRADNTLSTSFGYLPRSTPPAPSALRQWAYSEDVAPPGPREDTEGWESLGPRTVTGILFESRQVEVQCSFSLARPLSYTRGTFIPFNVYLSSPDSQALDLFAASGSLAIRLMRALDLGTDATAEKKRKRTDNSFVDCVGEGIYWLENGNDDAKSDARILEGEIPLRKGLKPSWIFPRVCLKYTVSLSLKVPSFVSKQDFNAESAFSRQVVITTDSAPGPLPRSRVPPKFEQQVTVNNNDDSIDIFNMANQQLLYYHGFA